MRQPLQKLSSSDFVAAEALKMWIGDLAIDQGEAPLIEALR